MEFSVFFAVWRACKAPLVFGGTPKLHPLVFSVLFLFFFCQPHTRPRVSEKQKKASPNSQFRCARPKLTSYSDSQYLKPHSTHCLVPTGIFGWIYRAEQYFGPGRGCCSGRKPVRFGKSTRKYPWVPRNVWSGVSGTGNPNMKLVLV